MKRIVRLDDADAVAEAAADRIVEAAERAITARERFVLGLSGGSTPHKLYRRLAESSARSRIPWDRTWAIFGDERCVPPASERSNYRQARETLLEHVPLPADQVLRIEGELGPAAAALGYESALRGLFPGEIQPRCDLLLLGLGPDGHAASLFPGRPTLDERTRWVVGDFPHGDGEEGRVSLSPHAIRGSRQILFLVTGAEKARIVAEIFGGRPHEVPYPAEALVPDRGILDLLVDRAAGAELNCQA